MTRVRIRWWVWAACAVLDPLTTAIVGAGALVAHLRRKPEQAEETRQ